MKWMVAILVAILLFSAFPAINSEEDVMIMAFGFKKPVIYERENGVAIDVKNCEKMEVNGMILPVKPLCLLLPYGTEAGKIRVYGKRIYLGRYKPEPQEPIIANGMKIGRKPDYEGSTPCYRKIGTYWLRGFPILAMNLYPVVYENGKLFYYPKMNVEIYLKEKKNNLYRGMVKDIKWIKMHVENPWMADSYDVEKNEARYDYVIITAERFADEFERFISYKEGEGIKVKVVSVEEILQNSSFWNETKIFNDTQAKIRNFIKYAYLNWGIDYVLLAGDGDVMNDSSNIIPPRYLYATSYGLPLGDGEKLEAYIPSDVYYACLDGNFNEDEDNKWGENASGNNAGNRDEADLYAEVWVGRACVDNAEEIGNFINKTIAYEESHGEYLMQVLLLGEHLGFGGAAEWGGNHKDGIVPLIPSCYNITRMYDRIKYWDEYELADVINRGIHIINHDGHGWTTYALKMRNHDLNLLNNSQYFFLYSQTCLAGSFDNWYPQDHYYEDDSFAEHITLSRYGAFACIMNSRYGLGRENSTDSPGQRYDYSFWRAIFEENIREIGRANHYSKEDNVWRIDENGMRWTYYETNLFGDPQVAIKEPEERINISIEIVRPENGIYVFDRGPFFANINKTIVAGRITIVANASTEPEGMVKRVNFYIDGVMKESIEESPYQWIWNERAKGWYTIEVEAIAENGNSRRESMEIFKIF